MSRRRTGGDETWARLKDWSKGQKEAERLASQILRIDGYSSVDPSHPLGGPDGLKDIVCNKDGAKWIGAAYFPRGQKSFNTVAKKFKSDLAGVKVNCADGIVFVTNQEIALSQRENLMKLSGAAQLDLFHLERVTGVLDLPACYGIRLEFLYIEMTKEEQLSFFAFRERLLETIQTKLEAFISRLEKTGSLKEIPLNEIKEFKGVLDSIAGEPSVFGGFLRGNIRDLKIPLNEIKEFKKILDSIAGEPSVFGGFLRGNIRDLKVPLQELKEFESLLRKLIGANELFKSTSTFSIGNYSTVNELKPPLQELQEYETALDRVIEKLKEAKKLQHQLSGKKGVLL